MTSWARSRAYLQRNDPWDHALKLATIRNLTHLELVDARISHVVLARIPYAHRLKSLILHGHFERPSLESMVLWSNHIDDTVYTFLPHLEEFRLVMVGNDVELALFQSVAQLLRQRPRLHRPGLPWIAPVHGTSCVVYCAISQGSRC